MMWMLRAIRMLMATTVGGHVTIHRMGSNHKRHKSICSELVQEVDTPKSSNVLSTASNVPSTASNVFSTAGGGHVQELLRHHYRL